MELYPDEAVLEAVEPVLVSGVLGFILIVLSLFFPLVEAVDVEEEVLIGGGGGGAMDDVEARLPDPRNVGSKATGARGWWLRGDLWQLAARMIIRRASSALEDWCGWSACWG